MNPISALSKKVCASCHNENADVRNWNCIDDRDWRNGFYFCPDEYEDAELHPDSNKCPYRLEHMMDTQKEPVQ